jgi:hypothetical protein
MMRIFQAASLAALTVLVAACNPAPKSESRSAGDWMPNSSDAPVVKEAFGVGDVEAALRIDAEIGERSKGPSVKEDKTTDMRHRLVMTTVDVTPPAPKELWVSFRLISSTAFKERPVAVRAKLFRDGAEIGTFDAVLGADATKQPVEKTVDVLAGLSAAPATMLVHAQAEVILLPAGTDPAAVDAKTASGAPDTTGAVLSNPVRINIAPAGGPA